jgi:hypothetical protein
MCRDVSTVWGIVLMGDVTRNWGKCAVCHDMRKVCGIVWWGECDKKPGEMCGACDDVRRARWEKEP